MFYNKLKKNSINILKQTEKEHNDIAQRGNTAALQLYEIRKSSVKAIKRVEEYINSLANSPKEFKKEVAEVTMSISEFNEAVKLEEQNKSDNIKGASAAAGGTVIGGAIVGLGPTAAMAVATTFGTASTGRAIADLYGSAKKNAAWAWLGGGSKAAGGGGKAAGQALLALAGPIGWSIAGLALVGGGAFASHKNKKVAEEAEKLTKAVNDKIVILKPKLAELEQLKENTRLLKNTLDLAKFNLFPTDYSLFSNEQKIEIATLINNTKSIGVLINKRII